MRWIGRRQSTNVEDRRGQTVKRVASGRCGTIIIILIIWLLGGNPFEFLSKMPIGYQSLVTETQYKGTEEGNQLAQFLAVMLGDTEDIWNTLFRQAGHDYCKPKLVLYTEAVQSTCGYSSRPETRSQQDTRFLLSSK